MEGFGAGFGGGLAARSRKKVIVRLEQDGKAATALAGYLPVTGVLNAGGDALDLLDTAGRLTEVPVATVRYVAYVRDFNLDDGVAPERLQRRTFLARPRSEGLWVRLTFSDGEVLEGLGGLDRSVLENAAVDHGIFLTPPDVRSNTQRIFVPRAAIGGLQVLAVVTTPSRFEKPHKSQKTQRQEHTGSLFPG